MAKSQWSFATATELSAALKAGKVSAVELAQDVIGRIERHDARINAVCVRDFTRGLEAARAADAARARGESKPLLGLPMTVKESYNVGGLPTTWGFPAQKNFVPPEDALSISRVKAAGGVILGKTNVPLALGDWQSYNDIYGTTNNPFDLTRTPGGSSGGSSAALAAGYGPLSLGSDIGGSLRVPAFHCGVYAHKPTFALAPSRGHTSPPLAAAAVRPRSRGDRADGAVGRRSFALAGRDRRAGSARGRQGLSARAAAAAPRRAEQVPRAADRHRSGAADRHGRARRDREARCPSRQGRRRGRAVEPAIARFRRFDAALYADAVVVPRGHRSSRRSMRAPGKRRRSSPPTTAAWRRNGCAASRSVTATGCWPPAVERGCARNGASCSRASMP